MSACILWLKVKERGQLGYARSIDSIKDLHGSGANDDETMDAQQFERVCGMFLEALGKMGSQGGERGSGGGNRALLDGKAFGRLEAFGGEEKKWKEWLFNVKVVIRSCNVEVWKWLVWIEGLKDQWRDEMWDGPDGWKAQMMSPDGPGHEVYEKASAELFGQLCLLTTGEANVLVRGAFGENGFVAWKRLLDRYDAKTPGRMLKVLLGVLRPSEIKMVKEVPKRMEEWEMKVKDLEREFDEKLSPNIKLAVFVGMLPKELQDEVYRSAENGKAEFEKAKDRIRAIAGNRIAQDTPQPMDIGQMAVEENYGAWEEAGIWGEVGMWADIDSVGSKGSGCFQCGEKGHFARECPSKGKGKGGKGKSAMEYGKGHLGKGGKDKGSWSKGYGGGKGDWGKGYPKGKGKGDLGGKGKGGWIGMNSGHIQCYTCGKYGHKSDSCRGIGSVELEVTEEEEREKEIGSVWMIASVETLGARRIARPRGARIGNVHSHGEVGKPWLGFAPLKCMEEEESDEEDDEEAMRKDEEDEGDNEDKEEESGEEEEEECAEEDDEEATRKDDDDDDDDDDQQVQVVDEDPIVANLTGSPGGYSLL